MSDDVQVAVETVSADAVETVNVKHEDAEYTIAKSTMSDLDVLEPWEDGQYVVAVRNILGPDQWKAYRSKKHDYSNLLELFGKVLEALNAK